MNKQEGPPSIFFRHITLVAHSVGIFSLVVILVCTVHMLSNCQDYLFMKWYFLLVAPIMTFFEMVWVVSNSKCCRDEEGHSRFWILLIWVDDALKPFLYIMLAVPCFLYVSPVPIVCGNMLLISAVVYGLKACYFGSCCDLRVFQSSHKSLPEKGHPKLDYSKSPSSQSLQRLQPIAEETGGNG